MNANSIERILSVEWKCNFIHLNNKWTKWYRPKGYKSNWRSSFVDKSIERAGPLIRTVVCSNADFMTHCTTGQSSLRILIAQIFPITARTNLTKQNGEIEKENANV
jgi:hypothetical protein